MPGLSSTQKAALAQFISFTQADKKTAEKILKTHNWNVNMAVDASDLGFSLAFNHTIETNWPIAHFRTAFIPSIMRFYDIEYGEGMTIAQNIAPDPSASNESHYFLPLVNSRPNNLEPIDPMEHPSLQNIFEFSTMTFIPHYNWQPNVLPDETKTRKAWNSVRGTNDLSHHVKLLGGVLHCTPTNATVGSLASQPRHPLCGVLRLRENQLDRHLRKWRAVDALQLESAEKLYGQFPLSSRKSKRPTEFERHEITETFELPKVERETGLASLWLADFAYINNELVQLQKHITLRHQYKDVTHRHATLDHRGQCKMKQDKLYLDQMQWSSVSWQLGCIPESETDHLSGIGNDAASIHLGGCFQKPRNMPPPYPKDFLIREWLRECDLSVKNFEKNLKECDELAKIKSSGGFYANPSNAGNTNIAAEAALNKLFDKYRDDPQNNPDTIFTEGAMSYFKDVQISLEDIGVLLISELLACPTLGEITRQGFVSGWSSSNASTTTAQRSFLSTLLKQLPEPESRAQGGRFRRVYKHTFKLACPPGSKSVPLEMAAEYWKILFSKQGVEWVSESSTPWLEWWLGFLDEKWKKAVNRDMWDQTLLFALKCIEDDTLSWWSEESAWPGIIDEFVAWVKAKGVGNADAKAMDVDG